MSQNLSVNSQANQYDYKKIPVSSFGGSAAGAVIGVYGVPLLSAPAGLGIVSMIHKLNDLPADKVEIIHNAAEKAIKDSGLAEKGVKIKFVPEIKAPNIFERLKGLSNPLIGVKYGDNACAVFSDAAAPLLNKGEIYMPEKKLSSTVFHEIGHQMNANLSKFGAILQKLRPVSMFLPAALVLFGAFTQKSEPTDGKKLTGGQKAKNFIRDNAGILAFISTLPMLAEEGMASIKGQKLAKQVLSKEMAAKVGKGNALAYLTYLASAACLSLGAWAAVKIKDKSIEKKQQEVKALMLQA